MLLLTDVLAFIIEQKTYIHIYVANRLELLLKQNSNVKQTYGADYSQDISWMIRIIDKFDHEFERVKIMKYGKRAGKL